MPNNYDLAIIIVTYNSRFWLEKCLLSLESYFLKKTTLRVKVVVVDNASQDETLTLLARDFPFVEVLSLPQNTGFAVANNHGLMAVKARYYLLLNSDIELDERAQLDKLARYLDQHRQVGVITPRVEFVSGALDLASHRGEPTPWASFTYFSGLEAWFPHSERFGQYHLTTRDLSKIHQIDACSGAAMMVRGAALKKVGLLDERFFMYAEDLDWCKRFRDHGYQIIFHPHVVVTHHKYKSGIQNASKKIAVQTRRHFYDTMLQYYDKHYREKYPSWVRSLVKLFTIIRKGAL